MKYDMIKENVIKGKVPYNSFNVQTLLPKVSSLRVCLHEPKCNKWIPNSREKLIYVPAFLEWSHDLIERSGQFAFVPHVKRTYVSCLIKLDLNI